MASALLIFSLKLPQSRRGNGARIDWGQTVRELKEGLRFVLYKPFRVDQLLDALESPEKPAAPPAQPQVVQA